MNAVVERVADVYDAELDKGRSQYNFTGSPDHRITGSPDHRITGSPDHRITGSPDKGQMRASASWGRSFMVACPPEFSFPASRRFAARRHPDTSDSFNPGSARAALSTGTGYAVRSRRRGLFAALLVVALLGGFATEAEAQSPTKPPFVSVSLNGPAVVDEGEVAKFRLHASHASADDIDVWVIVTDPVRGYYTVRGLTENFDSQGNPTSLEILDRLKVTIPTGQVSVDLDIETVETQKTELASHVTAVVVSDIANKANPTYHGGGAAVSVKVLDKPDDDTLVPRADYRLGLMNGPVFIEGDTVRMVVYRMEPGGGLERLPVPLNEETLYLSIEDSTAACPGYETLGKFEFAPVGQLSAVVTLKHQETFGTFEFTIPDDGDREDDGCITVTPVVFGPTNSYTIHVRDNTPPVASFRNGTNSRREVQEADVTVTVPVEFTGRKASDAAFDQHYAVTGTATRGTDFRVPNTVQVPRGHRFVDIPVTIIDDDHEDSGETVVLTLTDTTDYDPGTRNTFTLTIVNHDPNPAPGAFVADAALVAEVTAKADNHGNPAAAARLRRIVKGMTGESGGYTAAQCREVAARYGVLRRWKPWCDEIARREAHEANAAAQPAAQQTLPEVTLAGGGAVTEGTGAAFRITLSEEAQTDLAIAVDIAEAKDSDFVAAADEGSRSVTIAAGKREAVFAVATVDDEAAEDTGKVTATLAAGPGYALGSAASASVAVVDNDTPDIPEAAKQSVPGAPKISPVPGAIHEGETVTFTVSGIDPGYAKVLLSTNGTAVRDSDGADDGGEDFQLKDAAGKVRSGSYQYSPADGTLTFKVTALADDEAETDEVAVIVLDDPGGALNTVLGAVTVKDGPRPVAGVKLSATELALTEGTAGSYTLVLTKRPAGTVTVMVATLDEAVVQVNAAGGTPATYVYLTFTPANWNVPQTVTVTAPQDDDLADATVTVSHATVNTPGEYVSIDIPKLKVKVADDDSASAPELSVADARANESAGEIRFTVSLSHAAAQPVKVNYVTRESRPVSARENVDYLAVSLADVTFAPGETEKQVPIWIVRDSHDEGEETFELVLKRPKGATVGDGVAVGTIVNTDPLPAAWLARFGRTAWEQTLDAVERRLHGTGSAAPRAAVAGRELRAADVDSGADEARQLAALAAWTEGSEGPVRTVSAFELLSESEFEVATDAPGAAGGVLTIWGQGAYGSFEGQEGDLSVAGEVAGGTLGVDYAGGRLLAGLALSHSYGWGSYAEPETRAGEVTGSLTGAWPYVGVAVVPERLTLWIAGGIGLGGLQLTPEGDETMETPIALLTGASGVRATVVPAAAAGGFSLSVNADGMLLGATSETVPGMAAATVDVNRARVGLAGSYQAALGGGAELTPTVEVGVRHDGGDAETGFGMDVGGGLRFAHPGIGLSLGLSGRALVLHETADLVEWGASGALAWNLNPGTRLGPSLTVAPSIGASTAGGVEALWSRQTLSGPEGTGGDDPAPGRVDARFAYGLPLAGGVAAPWAGIGLSEGAREYRLGNTFELGSLSSTSGLSVELTATRREPVGSEAEHMLSAQSSIRW